MSQTHVSKRPATAARPARRTSALQRREAIEGYMWISPWIAGFLIFTAGPMIVSLYLSFTRYKIGDVPEWIGLENYYQAFFVDPLFWPSLARTIIYAVVLVSIGVCLSLLAAMLLNQRMHGRGIFRALFYLPSLTPVVAQAVIWGWLFQPQFGLVNFLLKKVGLPAPGWFTSQDWVIPGIIIVSLWASVGGGRMIIFLAGLQGVPAELYEAADLDGAGTWARFWNVTIPLISPTIMFNAIIGVIGSFSVFSIAYIASEGGPNYGSWFYMLHLYHNAFTYFQMGYASALAWVLFVLMMALTLLQLWLSKKWVHYEYVEEAR